MGERTRKNESWHLEKKTKGFWQEKTKEEYLGFLSVCEKMSQSTTVDVIIKLVVYGVPALLIMLGFLAYTAGYAMRAITQDSGMMNLGIALLVLGIVFYTIEFIIKVYAYFSES